MCKELEALNKIAYVYGYDENIKIIEAALNDYEILKNDFISMRDFKYEQLDALEVIKKKQVDIHNLIYSSNVDEYNKFAMNYNQELCNTLLTQEEFDLLKKTLIK